MQCVYESWFSQVGRRLNMLLYMDMGVLTYYYRQTGQGMCSPNGLVFREEKILRHGSHFGQKSRGPILPCLRKLRNIFKISRLWGEKTLRNGFRFSKNSEKQSKQPFLREKYHPYIWERVSDLEPHTCQKIIRVGLPPPPRHVSTETRWAMFRH